MRKVSARSDASAGLISCHLRINKNPFTELCVKISVGRSFSVQSTRGSAAICGCTFRQVRNREPAASSNCFTPKYWLDFKIKACLRTPPTPPPEEQPTSSFTKQKSNEAAAPANLTAGFIIKNNEWITSPINLSLEPRRSLFQEDFNSILDLFAAICPVSSDRNDLN